MEGEGQSPPVIAWLEIKDGGETFRIARGGDCKIGRSQQNCIVLDDKKVSRHHAEIRAQAGLGYLVLDLGSRNGTHVNGRRIHRPTPLNDKDVLELGSNQFVFREIRLEGQSEQESSSSETTAFSIATKDCYLLLVDIIGFTAMTQTIPKEELGKVVEDWIFDCKRAIEANGGMINQYLGDAVFAYWRADEAEASQVRAALLELAEIQSKSSLNFRIVLHFGEIRLGGPSASGEQNLMGEHVNFLFRAEKLASSLKKKVLLSESVVDQLAMADDTSCVGDHPVKDFEGEHTFFDLTPEG
jgi:adenylate cyclase